VTQISTMVDAGAIETLKARYCRLLDTKDWTAFRGVFTDDFVSDTSESGGKVIEGADAFVGFVSTTLAKAVTVHQVQQPEIDVTSDTTAHGVWAMQDVVRFAPGVTMHGFGHYVETYEKREGQWLIRSSKLTRLRMELQTPVLSMFVSDRLQRRMEQLSRRWVR
jgi:SnoaL-like domain